MTLSCGSAQGTLSLVSRDVVPDQSSACVPKQEEFV